MRHPRHRRAILASTVAAVSAVAVIVAIFAGGAFSAHAAAPSSPGTEVKTGTYYGVSRPARDLPSSATAFRGSPDRPLRSPGQNAGPVAPDPIAQTTTGPQVSTTGGLNFNGIGDTSNTPSNPCNCAPPDTNGAVGASQYVQVVNTAFGVYDKTTGAIASGFPKAINTLWTGFGGGCQTNNDGDPTVAYDQQANVWVISQFSVSTTPYLQCVAVSTTSDATGAYHLYSFNYGATQFPDYPKLGVWSNAYVTTYNIFNNGQTFAGPKVCVWDRSAMLSGATPTELCNQFGTSVNSILPADIDGSILPAAGQPIPAVSLGSNALNYYTFSPNFTAKTLAVTGPTSIPVASFSQACSGGTCIPQPGTSNKLDSLADRLMYRLAYRKFSDGHEALVVTDSVLVSGNKRSQVDGMRWYELRNPSAGTPTLYQQGTFSPDSANRWMGSIAMDKNGDIALGYSVSSGSVFPSIRYTGRVPTDTLGTMEAENTIFTGSFSQTGTLHRWGDYSAMQIDPVDDCTFWYTNEYLPANGSFNWATRIASFKFAGCV
jgi:hypothetical protein